MAQMRQARAILTLDGTEITRELGPYVEEMSFTDDFGKNAKDELTITLDNKDRRFWGDWTLPEGGKLTAAIEWSEGGQSRRYPLGLFSIDSTTHTLGPRRTRVHALSYGSLDRAKLRNPVHRAWESTTLRQVVRDIAADAGYSVLVECPDVTIRRIDQSNESPEKFLARLAEQYHCKFKVQGDSLVFSNKEYPSGLSIDLSDHDTVRSGELGGRPRAKYTGASMQYLDPATKQLTAWRTGTAERELKVNGVADSLADAKTRVESELKSANDKEGGGGSLNLRGLPAAAGTLLAVTGAGALNGDYLIRRATQTVSASGGWTTNLSLEIPA